MKLDERTKERINNYFNGISSEQAYKLAIKYNIVEAINWGKTQGQSEQLVCDCANKISEKESSLGQCLLCNEDLE